MEDPVARGGGGYSLPSRHQVKVRDALHLTSTQGRIYYKKRGCVTESKVREA